VRLLDVAYSGALRALMRVTAWREALEPEPAVGPEPLAAGILARVIIAADLPPGPSIYQPNAVDIEVVEVITAGWRVIHAVHVVRTPCAKPAYVVFDLEQRGRATA